MERISNRLDPKTEEFLSKTSILSYYIATYNAVNNELGLEDGPVTVDEIFDFIKDLKHEGGVTHMPEITRSDISLTFQLLMNAGLGEKTIHLPLLSN